MAKRLLNESPKFGGLTRKEFLALPKDERFKRLQESAIQFAKENTDYYGSISNADGCMSGEVTCLPVKQQRRVNMGLCNTCESAKWKRTKSGSLHPDKSGRCMATIIFCVKEASENRCISRADPMPDSCPLYKERELDRRAGYAGLS